MDPDTLSSWLETPSSTSAGWMKHDGSHESVGHASSRHIVVILNKNPERDPERYDDDDILHMRKVVSYWLVWTTPERTSVGDMYVQQAASGTGGDGKEGYGE